MSILSVNEATARGLMPLTVAEASDTPLRVGNGTYSMRYIEWLRRNSNALRAMGTARQKSSMRGKDRSPCGSMTLPPANVDLCLGAW